MQFRNDAHVLLNGNEVGRLSRVVIDPRNMKITDLVIRRGGLSSEEKIVPVIQVETTHEDVIVLRQNLGEWEDLQDYREVGYRAVDEEDLIRAGNLEGYSTPILFAYPPAIPTTGATYPTPGLLRNESNVLDTGTGSGFQKFEQENIPEGTIAIQPGVDVFSVDQEKLGHVERVLTSREDNHVSHLVITKGTIFKERKLIPVNWIEQVDEKSVRLGVSSRFINRLPEFEGD